MALEGTDLIYPPFEFLRSLLRDRETRRRGGDDEDRGGFFSRSRKGGDLTSEARRASVSGASAVSETRVTNVASLLSAARIRDGQTESRLEVPFRRWSLSVTEKSGREIVMTMQRRRWWRWWGGRSGGWKEIPSPNDVIKYHQCNDGRVEDNTPYV